MKKIEKLQIKTGIIRHKKGDTIVDHFIKVTKEMVVIKNKMNEVIDSINEIQAIKDIEEENSQEAYWTIKDGRNICIKDMGTKHIKNCIFFLQKAIDDGTAVREYGHMGADNMDIDYDFEDVSDEYIEKIKQFKKELIKRGGE
jgi:hypothetical protein